MKTVAGIVVAAWAALACVAAPCGVVSFSMKVAKSTEQPQKVIMSFGNSMPLVCHQRLGNNSQKVKHSGPG